MKLQKLAKKLENINLFIVAILFLIGISIIYFFYYRQKNQENLFVVVNLIRPIEVTLEAPFNWLPFALGSSIQVGTKEENQLIKSYVEVIEKETYESNQFGQYVYLTLKIKALKDRSGTFLYRSKPLAVGKVIELALSNTNLQGLVTYVGHDLPKYQYKTITLTVTGKNLDSWTADNIKIGSTIKDSRGEVRAKILDKKVTPAQIRIDTAVGQAVASFDPFKKDVEVRLQIMAKEVDKVYYYAELQKIKVNENLYLSFPEVSINYPISSILEIK